MANPNAKPPGPPWQPGQSGNPGGSTQGARRKIQGKFLEALAADFDAHGKAAIKECRENKPEVYMKVCASLLPKEVELTNPLEEIDDTTLAAVLAAVRAVLAGATGKATERGAKKAKGSQPTH
jgi:hypothetical protein